MLLSPAAFILLRWHKSKKPNLKLIYYKTNTINTKIQIKSERGSLVSLLRQRHFVHEIHVQRLVVIAANEVYVF